MPPRRLRRRLLLLGCAAGALVLAANVGVLLAAQGRVHRVADCPARPVALVLGCAPTVAGGHDNLHFAGRLDAAAALWHAGTVRHLLVSGDNSRADYDEPTAMRDGLVARGVPAAAITRDFAGRRTLDSVARARLVFDLDAVVIVTQRYHTARAIALARAWGLDAVACATDDLPLRHRLKTELREIASRAWAVGDIVCGTQPRFAGPPEPISLAER